MRAAQVQQAGGPFVVTDMPIPEPKAGQIRVKVHACGVCGGDAIPRNALFGMYCRGSRATRSPVWSTRSATA